MKYTLAAVMVAGLVAHLYIYTNRIVNHDGVFALTYSGSSITSGRWFLYFLTELAYIYNGNYITPWGVGVVTILLYGLAACSIAKTFNVKDKLICAALGTILVTFPTVTANNLYIFTAHYYALAFLLACVSVLVVNQWNNSLVICFGAGLLCLSLGIYQAYLPFVLTMYVLAIMMMCLNRDVDVVVMVKQAGRFLVTLVLGLVLYFAINKIALATYGKQMDVYMGMNAMGQIDIKMIPEVVAKCYGSFLKLFTDDFCGLNHKGWLQKLMFLCCVLVLLGIVIRIIRQRIDWIKTACVCLCVLLLPIAIGAIYIMVHEDKGINTMTTYAVVFVFVAPLLISDIMLEELSENSFFVLKCAMIAIIGVVSLYYANLANETYLAMEYSNMNVNAYFTQLATQIKSLDGFSEDLEVAFVGDIQDDTIPDIGCDYIIRGAFTPSELVNVYSREYFMTMHCGYSCMFSESIKEISEDERVEAMPAYPNNGSIQIIDDVIVVKFS